MPQLRPRVRGGPCRLGAIVGYPLAALHEEVAFIAYHFHWSGDAILALEHRERRRWVAEISRLNQRVNDESAALG